MGARAWCFALGRPELPRHRPKPSNNGTSASNCQPFATNSPFCENAPCRTYTPPKNQKKNP
eukprot:6306782-Lingulodinium_polyedra.AAC.1